MGAKVRVDKRFNRLYLDVHFRSRRQRIFPELPDTPRNRRILEAKAETIDRELFLGTFDPARHFPTEERKRRLTFQTLYEEWRRKKANEVTPLTLQWYSDTVKGKILPVWGTKCLDEFTQARFDRFKASLIGRGLAPRSVNIVLMRLRELLQFAYERGHLKENLSRWVILQKDRRPEIAPLSFEEKALFLKTLGPRWRPYFQVAFGTGLRPSEQLAVRWESMDWRRNKLAIREGWRLGRPTALKTPAAHREVDVLPVVRKALEQQRLIAGGSELIFPNRRGGHLSLSNLRQRVWYRTLKKAGLKARDLYNTRHTFATHALASGEDPGWVAKMLGHTTLTMLISRYYRYVPNLTRRDGSLLARHLGRPR
jgi:integrase